MAGIEVHRKLGLSKEEALVDAVDKGLLVSIHKDRKSSVETAIHWHKWDTHIYLLEGEFSGLDPDDDSFVLEPGDYIKVPAKVLHRGTPTKDSIYVIGITSQIAEGVKIDYSPDEL